MRAPAARTATIVFLAGLVSLAGYLIFTFHVSGERVGTFTVEEFQGNIVSFAGFRVTQGKTVTHTAGPVELTPEMNPLRMIVGLSTVGGRSVGLDRLNYRFQLVDEDGAAVWEQEGERIDSGDSSNKTSHVSMALESFEIDRAGSFVFLSNLTEASANHPIVARVDLTIKRNVAPANPLIAVALGMMSALSFVVMLAARMRS